MTRVPCPVLQSDANEKFNELEQQVQQIKDQIKVSVLMFRDVSEAVVHLTGAS